MIEGSAFATSLLGIQRGMAGLQRSAADIAQGDPAKRNEAAVSLLEHRRQVEVSAQTLKQADDTLGSLLDELA